MEEIKLLFEKCIVLRTFCFNEIDLIDRECILIAIQREDSAEIESYISAGARYYYLDQILFHTTPDALEH